jgi:DNA mismatch repair protein PMS2
MLRLQSRNSSKIALMPEPRRLVCLLFRAIDSILTVYIEVRFKDFGLESIECIDNGHGISPSDYDSIGTLTRSNMPTPAHILLLARKYHTSKLSKFEDIQTVSSFGFRGEALSSLCALGDVTMTTCTSAEAPKGTVLEFEKSGELRPTRTKIARPV